MNTIQQSILSLLDNPNNRIVVVLLSAFLISLFAIPIILKIARTKNFYDKPNDRNSHYENTPTLGGVAIFSGLVISFLLFGNTDSVYGFPYLIASLTIIFFIGIKDDISLISFSKKLMGQIIVIFILIFIGDIRFSSLYGFSGIYDIPYTASVIISSFVFIVIINSINLIDGVDGLASGLSILIAGTFSVFFYDKGAIGYLSLSVSLIGALIPFFIFNVFGKNNKLFMGDTGALVIGVVSVALVVKFNELSDLNKGIFVISSAPTMSIAIFFVPLYDTLQVFTYRVLKKKTPFSADKNHLHHRLIRLGLTHLQTSFVLISLNTLIIIGSYFMQFLGIIALSVTLLFVGLSFSILLWYLFRRKQKKLSLSFEF